MTMEPRGVCDGVWFDFEVKSYPNRKIKKHVFDLVQLTSKIKTEPNQTNVVWVRSVGAIFFETIPFFISNIKFELQSYNITYVQQCFPHYFEFHPTLIIIVFSPNNIDEIKSIDKM
jgi:hypothetical protein